MISKKKLSAVEFFRSETVRISHYVEKLPEEKKRRFQSEKPIMTKIQKEWVYTLIRELTCLLPSFVQGNILELARSMNLESHPVLLDLQYLIEECRVSQKTEEIQKSCRILDFYQVRQFAPTLSTSHADYYILSSDKSRIYFCTTSKEYPILVDAIQGCNRSFQSRK